MQTTSAARSSNNSLERNNQLLKRFLASIRSEVHRKNVLDYIHAYMRYWQFYEEEGKEEDPKQDLLNVNKKKKKNNTKKIIYRYDWLIGDED